MAEVVNFVQAVHMEARVVAGTKVAVQERAQGQQADQGQGQPALPACWPVGAGWGVHALIIKIRCVSAVIPNTLSVLAATATPQPAQGRGARDNGVASQGQYINKASRATVPVPMPQASGCGRRQLRPVPNRIKALLPSTSVARVRLRASGLPYTIVRPGWFDYNAADQHRLVLLQGDTRQELQKLLDELSTGLDKSGGLEQILNFLKDYLPKGASPLCGNTISQDRRFLVKFMPRLEAFFHYRNLDVSTLKELSRRWKPEVYASFKKQQKHTALADVHESIDELAHYREHFIRT